LVQNLRNHLDALLKRKIQDPSVAFQPAGQLLIQAVVDLITYEQVDEERFLQGRKQYTRRDKGWAHDMSSQYDGHHYPQPGQRVQLEPGPPAAGQHVQLDDATNQHSRSAGPSW
jgi:hypothetical protein